MVKNKIGRPPRYQSRAELEDKIEQYFVKCRGSPLLDSDGCPMLNKWGKPIIVDSSPPTVTGLALALGFSTRQALLNYQAKAEFVDTILRAKSRVEEYTEARLFDRDGTHGAQFSLRNNFKGWSDHPEETQEDGGVQIFDDV